jgi:hypothetical protein
MKNPKNERLRAVFEAARTNSDGVRELRAGQGFERRRLRKLGMLRLAEAVDRKSGAGKLFAWSRP